MYNSEQTRTFSKKKCKPLPPSSPWKTCTQQNAIKTYQLLSTLRLFFPQIVQRSLNRTFFFFKTRSFIAYLSVYWAVNSVQGAQFRYRVMCERTRWPEVMRTRMLHGTRWVVEWREHGQGNMGKSRRKLGESDWSASYHHWLSRNSGRNSHVPVRKLLWESSFQRMDLLVWSNERLNFRTRTYQLSEQAGNDFASDSETKKSRPEYSESRRPAQLFTRTVIAFRLIWRF